MRLEEGVERDYQCQRARIRPDQGLRGSRGRVPPREHRHLRRPALAGRVLGTDAVRTPARHLVHDRGHHRLVIDPAAANAPAIRAYAKVGFRPVGVMRAYERDPDGGGWHDGLLMDLLAEELDAGRDG